MSNEYGKFEQPPSIKGPRFGHTDDFSNLFGTSEEQEDYILGVIFAGALLMAIFLAWFISIIVFRCLGPRRVGFLSGGPFRRPVDEDRLRQQQLLNENQEDDDDVKKDALKDYYEGNSWGHRNTRVRAFFLLCGTIFITFSILSVTQGLTQLQQTLDTVTYNARVVDDLSIEAEDILANIKSIRETAVSMRNLLVEELKSGNFCPGDINFQQSDTADEILQQASDAVPLLEELDDFAREDVDDMESAAAKVQVSAQALEEDTEDIDFTSWQGLVILVPFTIIPAILMAATILAMFDVTSPKLSCFINWFVFPLFYLMVLFACIVSSLMIIGAGINSDFCLPSGRTDDTVDTSIVRILEAEGYHNETLEFRVAKFYIGQCAAGGRDPFLFIRDLQPRLADSETALMDLVDQLGDVSVLADLELYCNRDFDTLELLLDNMVDLVLVVIESLQRTLDLSSCESIVPIYTGVFYKGTCTYSIKAVMWVFSGFLIAGVFGLFMITMRSSYKQTIYQTPQQAAEEAGELGPVVVGDTVVQEVEPAVQVRNSTKTVENYGLDGPSGSQGGEESK